MPLLTFLVGNVISLELFRLMSIPSLIFVSWMYVISIPYLSTSSFSWFRFTSLLRPLTLKVEMWKNSRILLSTMATLSVSAVFLVYAYCHHLFSSIVDSLLLHFSLPIIFEGL